jgi:hypothetical protein
LQEKIIWKKKNRGREKRKEIESHNSKREGIWWSLTIGKKKEEEDEPHLKSV